MRPFEGVRVLDFSRVVSAPYCTQMLGFMGAEIIKIEDREKGDSVRTGAGVEELKQRGLASAFLMFNAGKKSLTLDLKKPEAKDIIMKLAALCDVAVENFRPGVMKRLGFDHASLSKVNPRLIYCSVSGYGQTGPDAGTAAFDGNIQAMSGMMAMSGEPDGPPMRAGYTVADTATGLNAAFAISAALYQRDRLPREQQRGQYIDVAMLDCGMSLTSQLAGPLLTGGIKPRRRANLSINFEPTADVYKTADGAVQLAIMRENHIHIFFRLMGLEYLITDPRGANREARVANAAFIRGLVQAEFLKAGTAEWKKRLDEAKVPWAPVLDLHDAVEQPQIRHRGFVLETPEAETGITMRTFGAPFRYEHDGPRPSFPPQRLGAQSEELLGELGYSKEQIAAFRNNQVI
jgi:crotonobetainyl-CoA:carnitine CoA-transferase CaiB-like acyl-CoA transferase